MLHTLKQTLMEREYHQLSEEIDEMIFLDEDTDLDDIFDGEVTISEGKTYSDDDFSDIPEDDINLGTDDIDDILDDESTSPSTNEDCNKNKELNENMYLDLNEDLLAYYEESFFTDEGQDKDATPVENETEEDIEMDSEEPSMEEDFSLYENADYVNFILEADEMDDMLDDEDEESDDDLEDLSESLMYIDFMEL